MLDRQVNKIQVMLREEWREGEREKGAEGEERWRDEEIDLLDRQFHETQVILREEGRGGGGGERAGEGGKRKMER